ncbi:MAG: class I SAM-dependent methyltransferase [Acidiferrobacteraceae bacterium]
MNGAHREMIARYVQHALTLNLAYIGIANGLLAALAGGPLRARDLAQASGMDEDYVHRWSDAAYAFELLESGPEGFTLSELGAAFRADAGDSLMPFAVQSILSAHMAERAAELMRSGNRPGESVLAERATLLPWFGPMLEHQFGPLFEGTILPKLPIFAEADQAAGLVIDLGCGNGWYLRTLARRYPHLRGVGLDGFEENVTQARSCADQNGFGDRLRFTTGDIYQFRLDAPAMVIAMNRALHHVWDQHEHVFRTLHDHLEPGGAAVIWEPNWPRDPTVLRQPTHRVMAFQNLSEHVQGNHFLEAEEIAEAARQAGLLPTIHLFLDDREAVIVARRAS